jgi:hypothetical protein
MTDDRSKMLGSKV